MLINLQLFNSHNYSKLFLLYYSLQSLHSTSLKFILSSHFFIIIKFNTFLSLKTIINLLFTFIFKIPLIFYFYHSTTYFIHFFKSLIIKSIFMLFTSTPHNLINNSLSFITHNFIFLQIIIFIINSLFLFIIKYHLFPISNFITHYFHLPIIKHNSPNYKLYLKFSHILTYTIHSIIN